MKVAKFEPPKLAEWVFIMATWIFGKFEGFAWKILLVSKVRSPATFSIQTFVTWQFCYFWRDFSIFAVQFVSQLFLMIDKVTWLCHAKGLLAQDMYCAVNRPFQVTFCLYSWQMLVEKLFIWRFVRKWTSCWKTSSIFNEHSFDWLQPKCPFSCKSK